MTVSTMIRPWRLRIALIAVALWPLAVSGQAVSVAGTLPEDYLPALKAILLEANTLAPRMLDQRITVAQAEAAKIQAVSGLYPRLTGSAGYGISSASSASGNSSSSSSSSGFSYGLSLGQPLFQEGDVKARADIGRLGEQIAQRNYAEAYRTLLGALRSQYMQLIVRKASVTQARLQVVMQEKELASKIDSIERGVIASAELPAAQALTETVRLAADRQAQDLENAKRLFARLAGLSAFPDSAIPDALPEPVLPEAVPGALLSVFLRGGVEETPQAQTYALYLRQSELNYQIAKYAKYPKVGLNLGYSTGANTSSDGAGNVSTSFVTNRNAGVSMGFTLVDFGAVRAGKLSAAGTKRLNERQLQTYIATTREEAENRVKQVSLEYRAMRLAETNRAIAAGSLALDKEYLLSGQRAELEVERSEAGYKGTEINAFVARANFLQQWADFVSLVGADPMMNQLPASYLNHGK
jgi:outer membrane protein TolC